MQAAAADRKGPPTFTSTFYTGGALLINGYDLPVVVDLAGLRNGNVLVANLDHDPTKRVGNFDVVNDGRQLVATGKASAATPARDEVVASALDGYVWQASLEVQPQKIDAVKRGESVTVNGRNLTGPLLVTRRGTLKGFAFVSHGADDDTLVSIAAKRQKARNMKTETDFESWMDHIGINMAELTDTQLATCRANFDGRDVPNASDRAAVAPLIAASAPADPVEAENRRLRQIDRATNGDFEDQAELVNDLKAQAIRGELSVDDLLQRMREIHAKGLRPPMAHTVRSTRRREGNARVMEAALCQSFGLPGIDKAFSDQEQQAAHDQYRGALGIQQILLAGAAANGYTLRAGERINPGNLREVLAYAFPQQRAAGFSTFSVPGILSNAGNKALLAGWLDGDVTWRQVAQIKSSSDFKAHTSYRLLDSLDYEQIGPGGEITHGTITEESYTRTINTFARMFSMTRTDIINDDLSAFEDMRVRVGRGALTKFNEIFWARFMNNSTFFHTDYGNTSTGSPGSVLGTDGVGLQAAVLKFRKLVSPDGKSVDGEPSILLVPPELEFNARRLFQSTNIVATGDTDATMMSANIYGGLYRPIVQRRLSDTAYSGYSTTAWYLLRNPQLAAVVAVSFLNGKQNPTVETAETDFNTLGIQMRGYHDWGCDLTVDHLAGVRSAGA